MIKSISMKDCATYSMEGCVIENCKKINFFYGPNGSGKSTISNFLYNQTELQYSMCDINWENNTCTDIVVYNRDFRNRHFKEDIDGIFTLGEATIEEIKTLDEMKKDRERKKEEYLTRKNSLNKKKEEEKQFKEKFRDIVWNTILKQNETDFQEVFSGLRSNKEKFRDEVITRYKKSHSSSKTRDALTKLSNTLFLKKPEKYSLIDMDVDELIIELMKIEKDLIWEKIVVGNQDVPIAKLIKHLGNADWVNKGRSYIGENGVCPFCQQKTITIELEQQLNTFFSGEYEKDIQYIKSLIEKYQNISEILISNLGSIVDNEFMVSIGNLDISKYNTLLETLKLLFISVLEKMSLKEKEASKKIVLVNSQEKLNELLNMISDANTNIINHNKIVDNYNDEKKKLIDDVWEFLKQERILRVYNQQLMRLTDLLKHMALQIFKLFHLLQKKIPIKYRDWMEHLPQIH